MSRTLLFEIGVEELPSGYVTPALEQMKEHAGKALADLHLEHGDITVYGTPRRLVLRVENVADEQPNREEEAMGPAAKVAFDADGNPTKALIGFCRGKGVDPATVRRVDTPKGEYVAVTVQHVGRPAAEVLPQSLAAIALKLNFPKAMRWLADDTRFGRPVRWLVALLGNDVLAVQAFELEAGRRTFGHRFLAPESIDVDSADAYDETLMNASVIVHDDARRAKIAEQIDALAGEAGGRVVADDELVDINNFLVEWPTAFAGSFDAKYLELPREVIIKALREHQRFHAVEDANGKLLPVFIAVRNGDDRGLDIVRKGNQDVLIARLEDAQFYWETDIRRTPEEQVPDLENVVWMEGLGSLREKATRLSELGGWLAAGLAPEVDAHVGRAALLCKTDLLGEMIGSGKEYASLEGVMGGYYARHAGEPDEVAVAISEHYQPKGRSDELPSSDAGTMLSLADKLDHVVGAFVAGKVPSGSEDPYGVRRAGNGVLRILIERELHVDLRHATELTAKPFFAADENLQHGDIMRQLGEFWRGRVETALEERGVAYDMRAAAIGARVQPTPGAARPGWIDPADCFSRAEALSGFRKDPRFEPLAVLFKRVANILKSVDETLPDAVDEALLEEAAEKELFAAFARARKAADPLWSSRTYGEIIPVLLEMERSIHTFFDDVLVNADDARVRANRLKLLTDVRALFMRGWDLSQVVLEGEGSRAETAAPAATR